MEGDIGNGKCINLVKVDADAVAVTPSSKQQELHTSERTIVSQTVIFVIVFVVDVQFWVVYILKKSCNFHLKAECAKACVASIGSRKQKMGLALPCSTM